MCWQLCPPKVNNHSSRVPQSHRKGNCLSRDTVVPIASKLASEKKRSDFLAWLVESQPRRHLVRNRDGGILALRSG